MRLVDESHALDVLRAIASQPTIPYHERRVLAALEGELAKIGVDVRRDRFGQLFAHLANGTARHAVAFMAHTDHPGLEVVDADGTAGRARILGGMQPRCFARPVPIVVHHDDGRPGMHAVADDFIPRHDLVHGSAGTVRVTADGPIESGMWAVLDLPDLERHGDELRLRAADDLAGCAMIVLALARLRDEAARPYDVHAAFTRAEETGLYGARIAAEDAALPHDAYVVSIEASRELPSAVPGGGIVVRAGDFHNTFSNEAERALRVAREKLAEAGIPTQRALLTGGTCEASAFVRLGHLATGIALPNVNYHNAAPEDRFAPEIVRLSDLRSGVALLVEAAFAAANDEVESWWPSNRVVSEAIRELLRMPDRQVSKGPRNQI